MEIWDNATSEIGYVRAPIVPGTEEKNSALLIRADFEKHVPSEFCWPMDNFSPEFGDQVVFRYAWGKYESMLTMVTTIKFSGSEEISTTETAVAVGEMMGYSEKEIDALRRATAVFSRLHESGCVSKVTVTTEDGTPKAGLPDDRGDWAIPLLLETSRRRATREFFSWIAQVAPPDAGAIRFVSVPEVGLLLTSNDEPVLYSLDLNLLNGTLLPDQSDEGETNSARIDLEMSYRRVCWPLRNGLADIAARFGEPGFRLGGFDPSGTRLSSLELIRDQWIYTNLESRFAVMFREYENKRMAVNLLPRVGTF